MKDKEPLNLSLPRPLVKRIRAAAAVYGDRISLFMAAGAVMMLESDPRTQGEFIQKVQLAELTDQVDDMLKVVAEEQLKRTKARETRSSK